MFGVCSTGKTVGELVASSLSSVGSLVVAFASASLSATGASSVFTSGVVGSSRFSSAGFSSAFSASSFLSAEIDAVDAVTLSSAAADFLSFLKNFSRQARFSSCTFFISKAREIILFFVSGNFHNSSISSMGVMKNVEVFISFIPADTAPTNLPLM